MSAINGWLSGIVAVGWFVGIDHFLHYRISFCAFALSWTIGALLPIALAALGRFWRSVRLYRGVIRQMRREGRW